MKPGFLAISVEVAQEWQSKIDDLLDHYHPTNSTADYRCVFCGNVAVTNNKDVIHQSDCFGARWEKILSDFIRDASQ